MIASAADWMTASYYRYSTRFARWAQTPAHKKTYVEQRPTTPSSRRSERMRQ